MCFLVMCVGLSLTRGVAGSVGDSIQFFDVLLEKVCSICVIRRLECTPCNIIAATKIVAR